MANVIATQLHVPYLIDTAQERLFHWYQEGINLFEKRAVRLALQSMKPLKSGFCLFSPKWIKRHLQTVCDTRSCYQQLSWHQEGRDRLLELIPVTIKSEELIATIEIHRK